MHEESDHENELYNPIADFIKRSVLDQKEYLLNAETRRVLSFRGLTEQCITDSFSISERQLAICIPEQERELFKPFPLLVGILAGDFIDQTYNQVAAYYPEMSRDVLVAKHVIQMDIDETWLLLQRAIAASGVASNTVSKSMTLMTARFAFVDISRSAIHSQTIIPALLAKM